MIVVAAAADVVLMSRVSVDSGGRVITVTGRYLDVVQRPLMNLHDRLHKFSSDVSRYMQSFTPSALLYTVMVRGNSEN